MREHLFYLISKYSLNPKRDLGQNFLIVPDIIERNIERAEVSKGDTVLEIGPGLGVLTDPLSKRAGRVYAIEKDPRLVEVLRKEYGWPNVEIIQGDAVKVAFPEFNKVVSNLPYQVSSPITFKILRHDFDVAVLIYQLEFAERMIAKPGTRNYSRLSLMVRAKADAELVERIGRGAFWPRPKVDSAVIVMRPKPKDERIELDENLVRTLFQHRKSTVRAALKKSPHMIGLSKGDITRIADGIPHSSKRVFQLTPEDVLDIQEHLSRFLPIEESPESSAG